MVNKDEKEFYNRVGKKIGWNFSILMQRTKVKGETWDFLDVVKKNLSKEKSLLDIGTGGAEKLLLVSDFCKSAVGIDNSEEMIKKAKENVKAHKSNNVKVILSDSDLLPLDDSSFDVIMCRHSPINPDEIARVLKTRGVFISQQVGEDDKINLKQVFKRGQSFNEKSGDLINKYKIAFKKLGFRSVKTDRYDAQEYYQGVEDLLFLLENTPIIPDFDKVKDKTLFNYFIKKYKTTEGIRTNSERFLIIAKK